MATDSRILELGRLAELGGWLAAVQGREPPLPFRRVRAVLFAANSAAAALEPSHPGDGTARLVLEIQAGGRAVNVAARAAGATVRVVELGGDSEGAVAAGRAVADDEIDGGVDLLVPGVVGSGNGAVAAALVAALTDSEPVGVVDRGHGDDAGWVARVSFVRSALLRTRNCPQDPIALLDGCGGPAVAALTGLLAQAAQRRTPVVLDGAVAAVAGLLAERLASGARTWWVAGTRSPEPAQQLALSQLGLVPLLDLGMRSEDGTGALLAVPLLAAAVSVARDEMSQCLGAEDDGA